MAASGYPAVQPWNVATGETFAILEEHSGYVFGLAFSPDGTLVATGDSDKMIRLWEVASGNLHATLEGHSDDVYRVAFSPDGRLLVSAGGTLSETTASLDNTIRLWDVATGEQLAVLDNHSQTVNSAFFSPDGMRIVSAGADGTIRLWGISG